MATTTDEKQQALVNAGYVVIQGVGGRVYVEHDDFMHVADNRDKAIAEAYDMAFPIGSRTTPSENPETFVEIYERAMKGVGLS